MVKYLKWFRNKYILTLVIFLVYNLFLDDIDLFSILTQNRKLSKLRTDQSEVTLKLNETKKTLRELKHGYALENYARAEKLFKKEVRDKSRAINNYLALYLIYLNSYNCAMNRATTKNQSKN
jgi:hypothetical protein